MASNNLNKNQVIHTSSTEQHKDTAKNQIEFTQEYRQKLEENWELIKDDSDSEIAPWQRIMRVNKLMLDLKCREMIEYLLKPVYSMVTRLE
jgi:predicted membrane GTPase involved in stress response